jgi:hypothetical protein
MNLTLRPNRTARARRTGCTGDPLRSLLSWRTSDTLWARRASSSRRAWLARQTVTAGLARGARGSGGTGLRLEISDDILVRGCFYGKLVLDLLNCLLHAVLKHAHH